jgi:hypothetical protein
MGLGDVWRRVAGTVVRRHRDAKSFEHELHAVGGMTGRGDLGARIVPTEKVVGSVSRWQNLRSDFFYRRGQAITARFLRVGEAIQRGLPLPPVELYKIKRQHDEKAAAPVSEYYVVDGHHRVAMARKLGQAFLDAHVVEYHVSGHGTMPPPASGVSVDPTVGQGPSIDPPAAPCDERSE